MRKTGRRPKLQPSSGALYPLCTAISTSMASLSAQGAQTRSNVSCLTTGLAWSPEFAYVVGLIASDGNLQANANEVRLASTDRQIIDLYCWCLGLRPDDIDAHGWGNLSVRPSTFGSIRQPPYKEQYHIIFSDYVYRARLEQIGLTPQQEPHTGTAASPRSILPRFPPRRVRRRRLLERRSTPKTQRPLGDLHLRQPGIPRMASGGHQTTRRHQQRTHLSNRPPV